MTLVTVTRGGFHTVFAAGGSVGEGEPVLSEKVFVCWGAGTPLLDLEVHCSLTELHLPFVAQLQDVFSE